MKVIDLLNKIANGEEVPKKVKYANDLYYYHEDEMDYYCNDCDYDFYLFSNHTNFILNDEVEIIEEEKKIPEKIDVNYLQQIKKWKRAKVLGNKINEIIDYLEAKENDNT